MPRLRRLYKQRKRTVAALLLLLASDSDNKRSVWAKPWLRRCGSLGPSENLQRELALEDPLSYRRYLRMDQQAFELLVELVGPYIVKKDTLMRQSISNAERLSVALRYLATGESFRSLSFHFRISVSAIAKMVPEVCTAIYTVLQPQYMAVPANEPSWLHIAQRFSELWNFPNCIGALDGKHIHITSPAHSGSQFYNYKHTFSIVLLAVVDADLNFVSVDVGSSGRNSDGGIWERSKLIIALEGGTLNIPPPRPLPSRQTPVPYIIVADEGFGLKPYLMRPYSGSWPSKDRRIFNYRLSRARRIVENCFGIMASRFRVFHTSMRFEPEKAVQVVLACTALHNYLRRQSRPNYTPEGSLDGEDMTTYDMRPDWWRTEPVARWSNVTCSGTNSSNRAKKIIDYFSEYFISDGQVTWQEKACLLH